MISENDMQKTEDEIRRYFRYATEIDKLKHRMRFLENEKSKIENDIANSNIRLDTVMPGSAYDADSIRGSGPASSQQEKALESAFAKLERQLERINNDIMDIKEDIRDLEYQNCDMNFVLDKLDETARGFVNLYYGRRMGYIRIANALHLSTSSLSRLRLGVLTDISGYVFYMKQKR